MIHILTNKIDGMWKEVFFVLITPKSLSIVKIPKNYIKYLIYIIIIKAKSREKSLVIVYLCLDLPRKFSDGS